ncbi:unnamed protein product [Cuscuta europaea]|uniref:Retrotransposon gag domain-containing protein n=1 Tax=Cuscuta europaea TaxID=41803 RepID=A0A9P0YXW0_CUSEU|nr:unnamed protein product [Cuscuta europaea]
MRNGLEQFAWHSGRERNSALWTVQYHSPKKTHLTMKIGGPIIHFWCLGFETRLNPHFVRVFLTLRWRAHFGMISSLNFRLLMAQKNQQLKRELADCKQRGMKMVAYYGKLKKIWDDFNDLDQFPTCTCGKCTCDLSARIEKKRDEEKVHQLLMGLDEKSYGVVRSNLLTQEPLPSVGRVYAVLTQDESSRNYSRTQKDRGEITSFAAQVVPREKGREMKDRECNTLCTNCRKPGHEIDNCFQLIGYPEWWPKRTKLTGRGNGRPKKGGAGRGRGTTVGRGRGSFAANVVVGSSTGVRDAVMTDADRTDFSGLNDEQWQTLLNLLSAAKSNPTEKLSGPHYEDSDWCG